MLPKKQLTKEQALQQIKNYCAYQERCHGEVQERLYSLGVRKAEREELIANLIENNYLNEERFATQYAGGKFRIKHWGRKKIIYELGQKGVSSFNIKIALKTIDNDEYYSTLRKLAQTKWESLAGENFFTRQAKTTSYLLQKGFETSLITQIISEIKSAPDL